MAWRASRIDSEDEFRFDVNYEFEFDGEFSAPFQGRPFASVEEKGNPASERNGPASAVGRVSESG